MSQKYCIHFQNLTNPSLKNLLNISIPIVLKIPSQLNSDQSQNTPLVSVYRYTTSVTPSIYSHHHSSQSNSYLENQ